ncbi:MAG: aryldialkylphosphatase [SAR202 cluster bacterium]|nr:aryldialkylphosphatase [SAR202 cluster bacterium]
MTMTNLSGKIQTVLGPIDPGKLGVTMTHEHLLIDFRCVFDEPQESSKKALAYAPMQMENLGWIRYNWRSNLDNLSVIDEATAIAEAQLYARAGGNAIVDATSRGIGRDPLALARIARATGLNIVMGACYYVGVTHPKDMAKRSVEELAEETARDVVEGVGVTGVRAGIIGEIGCSWPWQETERKAVQAGAMASKQTGAPILIHPGRHPDAPMEIMNGLQQWGASPPQVIISHIERTIYDLPRLKKLAETGCYIEWDLFGHECSHYPFAETHMPSDAQRIDQIAWLMEQGFEKQIVVAQDICTKHRLVKYGGHGYAHILENIVPRFRRTGLTEDQINMVLVENPRRVLTFR